jgi:hypothetical protein
MAVTNPSAAMVDALYDASIGRLKHVEVNRRFTADNFEVRMVIYVDAQDELEVYKRLLKVLEVCIKQEM